MLRIIGVSVGSVKWWKLFNMLVDSVFSDMKKMNGKVSCIRLVVRLNLCGWFSVFGVNIEVICGVKIMFSVVISSSMLLSVLDMWVNSCFNFLCEFVCLILVNIGMKVVENDFFVNRCCMKLGMWKVMMKVLVVVLVLNMWFIEMLWIRLRICEIIVMLLNDSSLCSMLGDFMWVMLFLWMKMGGLVWWVVWSV